MNENLSSNDLIVATMVDLLNEIGHELKNKVGAVGSLLKDIKAGYPSDEESLDDSLKLYEQVISLANLISQDLSLQDSQQNKNGDSQLEILEYIKTIVVKVFELSKNRSISSPAKNLIINIETDEKIVSADMTIPEELLRKIEQSNIFITPGNSPQKILSLQLNLIKTIYNYDSIKIRFKSTEDSTDILHIV